MAFELEELNEIIKDSLKSENHLIIEENIINNLSIEDAKYIDEATSKKLLFKLPEREIIFFEWLKENDPLVWNDLWKNDNISELPYMVSTIFLPVIVENPDRGFPICDLVSVDNYFFSIDHMVDEESKVFFDVANAKLKDKKRMTTTELLSLEISLGDIDIWHFAYKFKLPVSQCKAAVEQLTNDFALVHLKEAEYIAPFIKF